jgi:hypothetical protein
MGLLVLRTLCLDIPSTTFAIYCCEAYVEGSARYTALLINMLRFDHMVSSVQQQREECVVAPVLSLPVPGTPKRKMSDSTSTLFLVLRLQA